MNASRHLSAADNDRLFDALSEMYDSMPRDEAEAAMARLILILANRLGDFDAVAQAIEEAKASRPTSPGGAAPSSATG